MALVKCRECSNEISSEAKSCPKCGAENKHRKGCLARVVMMLIGFMLFISFVNFVTSNRNTDSNKSSVFTPKTGVQEKAEEKPKLTDAQIKSILKPFNKKTDKIDGITWYKHPYYINNYRSRIEPYIGESNGRYWLRVSIVYHSNKWLFIQAYKLLSDGKVFDFPLNGARVERDHNSQIWEWVDVKVDDSMLEILNKISSSKNVEMRYVGQKYNSDRIIESKEKKAIKTTIEAYKSLLQLN